MEIITVRGPGRKAPVVRYAAGGPWDALDGQEIKPSNRIPDRRFGAFCHDFVLRVRGVLGPRARVYIITNDAGSYFIGVSRKRRLEVSFRV